MNLIVSARAVEFDDLPEQIKYYYNIYMNQRDEIKSIWYFPDTGMAKRNYYRISADNWIHQWTYDPPTDTYGAKNTY